MEDSIQKISKKFKNKVLRRTEITEPEGSPNWIIAKNKELYEDIQMRRSLKLKCMDILMQYLP